MVRKICLDSNIIIQFLRNDKKIIATMELFDAVFYATSINIFEVWYGKKKLGPIAEFIEKIYLIDFNKSTAIKAAEIMLKLRDKGETIEYRDAFVAAACITYDVELMTLNTKHFERLKKFGLKLVKT